MIEKASYKYGSTSFVSQEKFFYSGQPLKTINYWSVPVLSALARLGPMCNDDPNTRFSCGQTDPDKGYILGSFGGGTGYVNAAWIRLDKTERILDNIKYVKRFTYRNIEPGTGLPRHTFPIIQEEDLSNGDVRKTFLYYPGETDPDDVSNTLGLPQMWDVNASDFKNLVGQAIKAKTFINTDLVAKQNTGYTYDAATGNLILTSIEKLPHGQVSGKEAWAFNYDEKANLIGVQKEHELPTATVWGYSKRYPIGEVTNAAFDRVAYTSFEGGDYGGWSLNAGSTLNTNAIITGKKTYSGD